MYNLQVGCYVVVFAWYNMLMSLKKLPLIGIYVIMIKIHLESFIKVMLPIFLFLIPYILMFHMSFPKVSFHLLCSMISVHLTINIFLLKTP